MYVYSVFQSRQPIYRNKILSVVCFVCFGTDTEAFSRVLSSSSVATVARTISPSLGRSCCPDSVAKCIQLIAD